MSRVELNADVGEGFDDEALLPSVDRASIACGGHTGDLATMRVALARCLALAVVAGAHPSYPDRSGFGRRALDLAPSAIADAVAAQVATLAAVAAELGMRILHVKPHGALYLRAWRDPGIAAAVVDGVATVDRRLALLGPPGSELLAAAGRRGLATLREGFVDRAYLADGRLAPRELPGALLADRDAALAQGLALAQGGAIAALDGGTLRPAVDSLCLHGDSPGASTLAADLRRALLAAGLSIGPASCRPADTPPRGDF